MRSDLDNKKAVQGASQESWNIHFLSFFKYENMRENGLNIFKHGGIKEKEKQLGKTGVFR